ncbi:MAG: hypothetical protein AAF639_34650 [Chloroflexota bacterium]
MNAESFVIVISGASGAGKTTLTRRVVALLDDAVSLHFDDYKSVAEYPNDMAKWVEDGKDLDAWKIPQLQSDLALLKSGHKITLPAGQGDIGPARFIVLEEPSGRERVGMHELVDFVVLVDIPLEIALSRKVVQDLNACLRDLPSERLTWAIEKVTDYYSHYELARTYYLTCIERVRADSNLVVDGTKTTNEQATEIVQAVKRLLRAEAKV